MIIPDCWFIFCTNVYPLVENKGYLAIRFNALDRKIRVQQNIEFRNVPLFMSSYQIIYSLLYIVLLMSILQRFFLLTLISISQLALVQNLFMRDKQNMSHKYICSILYYCCPYSSTHLSGSEDRPHQLTSSLLRSDNSDIHIGSTLILLLDMFKF